MARQKVGMKFKTLIGICLSVLFLTGPSFAQDIIGKDGSELASRVETFIGLNTVKPFSHDDLFNLKNSTNLLPVVFELSLKDMISLARKNRLDGALGREKINEALGRSWQAMSAYLPDISGGISQSRTFKQNLAAVGMPGFGVIGPFNTFDARIKLVQRILDVSAASNAGSARAQLRIARDDAEFTDQKISLIASLTYLDALRAQGAYYAAQAAVDLSGRLLQQAEARKQAGIAASIDVARASTRLAEDQLSLQRTETALHNAYLEVQRATAFPYDRVIALTNSLCFINDEIPSVSDALKTASTKRLDMRISEEQVNSAKSLLMRSRGEWFPVVAVSANYGYSGIGPDHDDRKTSGIMISAAMPLFEGGRIVGAIKEATSRKHQAELIRDNVKQQIEEDVRKALWTITNAIDQVHTSARVVELSHAEMDLASHRYSQGIADHIEVVNAQASLAQARDGYVSALTQYHAARINLYFALGEPDIFFLKDADKTQRSSS